MAATALAARTRQAVWSVWAMQGRGFGSEQGDNVRSSAGVIRDAGGAFGKREQAEEERYFRARAKEQLATLKKHHENEISHHAKEIERLQKEIERHKQSIKKLKQSEDDD
ncbi:ATPase inhibitor, mitochondrial-like [Dama dama]|uniref:ATPase inhibitor, mitochondrial-like n=1 Tax=Dama dama TaxID=30532 RepID=UPI002A35B801|nr:ATPase inhibitor, mitochondrial-like [Dama dama]